MAQRASRRGYTLVELMIVVAIIALLAALGIYSVRRYVYAAKTSEATELVNAIRAAQEQYKDERFRYLNVSPVDKSSGSFFPFASKADLSKNQRWTWYTGTSGEAALWAELGVAPSSPVQFGYACQAGQGGGVPASSAFGSSINLNYPPSAPNWYIARAMADRSGQGVYTVVVGSSFTDVVHIEREAD
jgi:type IV pilus assembly protein PilA